MSLFSNPFEGKSLDQLNKHKAIYEKLIAEQSDNYEPPVKNGRKIMPTKMPWMLEPWKKGLAMVNEQISKQPISNKE